MKKIWIYILAVITILGLISIWQPFVAGEKRWATYTGVLVEFDIDCSQCCHPSSYFRINTSNGIKSKGISNCDEHIENLVNIGEVYTIRIEPYAEPFGITHNWDEPSFFWAVCIDWVKDANGNIVYGSEWF